ncbi:citrate/2-methylcitrate synthase [Geobacter sp.]|uniref:citrate/2-methylcitrate synthase n=1 Tax=Geobacter sp. TaxID=46610 RepID=UPI00261624E0|nr:citrate/2-methylcitrate synthase [Geobacter sp.]
MNYQNNPFPYHVGVQSLHELANKHSRVCIMNIRGTESSLVTPVSHAYSGGNVVAGVQYGEPGGAFETPIGDIPVFGSISDVIRAGIHFDTGVIYLPPGAVSHAVSEMCARNVHLKRIVIVTEKVSARDSRLIRYGCQNRKVDVIGANTLGIANSWDQVRIGGALGGDSPAQSLRKGSVAIYSNSGNFSTTISEYLKTAGFGTSTILSSGKDIYIHFALAEFLYCAENDPRTKAVVVYVEPGGYYEKQAMDWIEEGRFKLTKPIVACVTGRWKKNLTRSCGHAGAMAGCGDDAEAKEGWFDAFFGVPVFEPAKPQVSKRGVRIRTIQDVPEAVSACMELLGEHPDFPSTGDLSLKPWFVNDQELELPPQLRMQPVRAISPYGEEIEKFNRLVGARIMREPMRNRSGASFIDPSDFTIALQGRKLLDLIECPFGAVTLFSVLKSMPDAGQMAIVNPLLNWFTARGSTHVDTVARGRANGCTPNAAIGAEVMLAGNNRLFEELRATSSWLIDRFFPETGSDLTVNEELIETICQSAEGFPATEGEAQSEELADYFGALLRTHGQETILTRFAQAYSEQRRAAGEPADSFTLLLAAMLLGLAWKPLAERRIVRETAQDLGTYLGLNGIIAGVSPVTPEKNRFWQQLHTLDDPAVLATDFASTCFQILFNRAPNEQELFTYNALLNLTVTNGPGTLSAKGAKESVSARNHIATAYAGFMTNTGLAHGGNGFESVGYLLDIFAETDPYQSDPADLDHVLNALAAQATQEFVARKRKAKMEGATERIPCINHPVFRDRPENHDPREVHIRNLLKARGVTNPFLEFYHHLVKELHAEGVTDNVYCVNVDAAIACIALDLLWKQLAQGEISEQEAREIVFIMFLHGRMAGVAAEIADHRSRGQDLDCRTQPHELAYLA